MNKFTKDKNNPTICNFVSYVSYLSREAQVQTVCGLACLLHVVDKITEKIVANRLTKGNNTK